MTLRLWCARRGSIGQAAPALTARLSFTDPWRRVEPSAAVMALLAGFDAASSTDGDIDIAGRRPVAGGAAMG
jgi:hypothetical protein